MNTIQDVFEYLENRNPASTMPYPLVGVMSDGTILKEGETGGTYIETGLTWDFTKSLQDQIQDVQDYLKNM